MRRHYQISQYCEVILKDIGKTFITEIKTMPFWRNFHHWLHWKLSIWQLPVQPMMKILSKWQHLCFSDVPNNNNAQWSIKHVHNSWDVLCISQCYLLQRVRMVRLTCAHFTYDFSITILIWLIFSSHPKTDTGVSANCCTWHSSCAFVVCTKFCNNFIAWGGITVNRNFPLVLNYDGKQNCIGPKDQVPVTLTIFKSNSKYGQNWEHYIV